MVGTRFAPLPTLRNHNPTAAPFGCGIEGATHGLQEFQARNRRRRHRARHLGHSRPFDERAGRDLDQRARGDRQADHGRRRRQGRRHHLGQGGVLRRRRSLDARGHEPHLCRTAEGEGRGRRQPGAVRPEPPLLAGVPLDRNLRQAVGRRHQRARARRRLRAHAVLPLSRRRRKSQDPARSARDQGRPVSRRRRHPARAAHRLAAGCDATAAEGRGDQPRAGPRR